MRAALMVAVLAALAAPARAAVPTPESVRLEEQYVDRLIGMEDSAAAHAALAKWCTEVGLDERAAIHWQEALARDPDHAAARAALGFVRRGEEWIPAEEAPPEPSAVPRPAPPPPRAERRFEIAREVREIYRTLLVPGDAERWAEGHLQILRLRDEVAAHPVARILGGGSPEHRVLACRALAGIPGDAATSYLLGFLLSDPEREVHEEALEALSNRLDDRVVDQLVFAVLRGRDVTMQRAAHALGRYRVRRAVPALIANLRIVHYRRVVERAIRYPPPIRGTVIPFVAGVRPVVGKFVVAHDPIIGYITPGGIRIPEYERPREVLVEKTRKELVPVPLVREALVRITDQDFGYDEDAWRRWWRGARAFRRGEDRGVR